jgi:predicted DNA-binding transcriptional regulator AlpA
MNPTSANDNDLLLEREAAEILRVSCPTMRRWRWARTGPRYVRVGSRAIRYRLADLKAFVAANDNDRVEG